MFRVLWFKKKKHLPCAPWYTLRLTFMVHKALLYHWSAAHTQLRIGAIHKAQKQLSFTFCPISLQLDRLSKIWGAFFFFWQRVHRCKKCPDIWKVTSSTRGEMKNVNYASGNIFNFTSATRVHFLSPVATRLRKGDIGLPFVRPFALNNFNTVGRMLMISHTGL